MNNCAYWGNFNSPVGTSAKAGSGGRSRRPAAADDPKGRRRPYDPARFIRHAAQAQTGSIKTVRKIIKSNQLSITIRATKAKPMA